MSLASGPVGAGCRLVTLPRRLDPRGALVAGEAGTELPFVPVRFFVVSGVPDGTVRGGHANRSTEELLVALGGRVTVEVDDGSERAVVVLDDPAVALHLPAEVWSTQRYDDGAVLLVLASDTFDPAGQVDERPEPDRASAAVAEPVRFLDLAAIHGPHRAELARAHARVLASGRYLLGAELDVFEARWAEACGTAHAVGVGSGLDALTLALRGMDIGPGDEVVVPSNTYIATWLAVSAAGATPVPVEPDPATHLVTADGVRAVLGPRTAAVLPVHLYGRPVEVDRLKALASAAGLALLFDAAQAHGATVSGRPVGAGGTSAWSFYPGKNLGALGDGGAVTTDDPALAARIRRLRNYGSEVRGRHAEKGLNSRLDELQAASLSVLLGALPAANAARAATAARFDAGLEGTGLVRPEVVPGHAWHLYVVRSPRRDRLQAVLAAAGVETLVHYPVPPHLQEAYAELGLGAGSLPVAEQLAAEVLSLPIGPHLDRAAEERVLTAVRSAAG